MKRYTICVISVLMVFSGCYYGSMTGARTLGENHMTLTGGIALPTYLSADDRAEAEETNIDDVPISPSLTFLSGATSNIDVGISAKAYGLGPIVRAGLLPLENKLAVSILGGASYVVPAKLLATNFGLSAGYVLGNSLETYAGWYGGYGPDVVNLPENNDGEEDWTQVENTFYQSVSVGILYELPARSAEWIPESLCFEFSAPLGLARNLVMFGLALTY